MRRIFLGPPVHWLIVVVLAALGWLAGTDRMHVISFNLFIGLTIAVTVAILLFVLRTSPPGQQVTRDPVEDD